MLKKFKEFCEAIEVSHESLDDDEHGRSETPKHIIDAHHKEAEKRGLKLTGTAYKDHLGISSRTHRGGVFSTEHDAKTGKYNHEHGM